MQRGAFYLFVLSVVVQLVLVGSADAVPSFARQTGMACYECHVSWPELTPAGRRFKLGGFVLNSTADDERRPGLSLNEVTPAPRIPLAFELELSGTHINALPLPNAVGYIPPNNHFGIQELSVLLAGQIVGPVGCFCELTYHGDTKKIRAESNDVRIAHEWHGEHAQAIYGLSLNNSPSITDIYNTTPNWGWPYSSSALAATPVANTLINGRLQPEVVAGLTAYGLYNNFLYAEAGVYAAIRRGYRVETRGVPQGDLSDIRGGVPYYRFALQHEWRRGRYSAEIGTFGLAADIFPATMFDAPLTDHYRDVGYDAQFQYNSRAHRFSLQARYSKEEQVLNAEYLIYQSDTLRNTVHQIDGKVSYFYKGRYGMSIGYQQTTGSTNSYLYRPAGSINGDPSTQAAIGELTYEFALPGQNSRPHTRLKLQYTDYSTFNGATANYDGYGRNARDNNAIYLVLRALY